MQIVGDGVEHRCAKVVSVSEASSLATVQLFSSEDTHSARYSDEVQVPLARLRPIRNEVQYDVTL